MPTLVFGGYTSGTAVLSGVYAAVQGYETTTPFNVTNNATPASITGLGAPVLAGHNYTFEGVLWADPDLVGGWQVGNSADIVTDTVVMSVRAEDDAGAGGGATQRLAIGQTAGGDGSAAITIWVWGILNCVTSGTFSLTFAQKTATPATTSSVAAGMLWIKETP